MTSGVVLKGPRCEVAFDDGRYPDALRQIARPPDRLYVVGNVGALVPGLAVVGARRATPYGAGCARRFARIAAEKGITIISGGARGCDSEAHRAALEAGGRTVVFLGGGCDELYPPEHFSLFQSIVDAGGAVVSEHPWDCPPLRRMFRERNRLIAGLADAVLIVEAGLPSGTFSTADEALDAGKEVLVVPGSITSESSRGSNRLLLQGAMPIVDDESFEDALFRACGVLKWPSAGEVDAQKNPSVSDDPIVEAIQAQPLSTEDLYTLALCVFGEQQAREKLMEKLVEAEALGIIARQPDGRWGPVVRM